jgi:acetyltransferase-like isoleucine patch superfamily enzyme
MVFVDADGLWSTNIRVYSDDMHAIRDVSTGERINAFGGRVIVGRHVWLGFDVLLLPGTEIGADSVVGARSIVTGALPANAVSVGSPARPIRYGITWSPQDLP